MTTLTTVALTMPFRVTLDDVTSVIEKTGEEEGYTFIIEKGTVPYSNKNIDVTDLIIKKYNETKTIQKKS